MSIIKRKKQDKFFIMSNHAIQENLTSLNSIGLLAYIKSLPSDWTLYKTFLQKKFSRRTVDSAWAELVEKNYIAGFCCYVDRKKQYSYLVHDEPLTQKDYNDFVAETVEEIINDGFEPKNLQLIKDCKFSIVQIVQHLKNAGKLSDVQSVQYKKYSTSSTAQNEQIQINSDKDIPQINSNKEISSVNTSNYQNYIHSLFYEDGQGLFNKDDIFYFTDKMLNEEIEAMPDNPEMFFKSLVDTIIHRRKKKLGMIPPTSTPFYNWLEH